MVYRIKLCKVMRCSRYVNVGRMNVRLESEPLKDLDCLKYFGDTSDRGWRILK